MKRNPWTETDDYYNALLIEDDKDLEAALRRAEDAGLPPHAVSAAQGKFLHLLTLIHGAKQILEIGTLGGYSTLWMAKALPEDGMIVTLEFDPKHAEVAQNSIRSAGFDTQVDLRVGAAIDTLPLLHKEGAGPFDLIFIDADKPNNPGYFQWAMKLSRPGTVIIADNVVREGHIIEEASEDPKIQGIRHFNAMVAQDQRVSATTLQTVGEKGYDGFMLIRVKS